MKIIDSNELHLQAKKWLKEQDFCTLKQRLGLKRLRTGAMHLPLSRLLALYLELPMGYFLHAKAFWYSQHQLALAKGQQFVSYSIFMKWMARFDRVLELWMDQRKKNLSQSDLGFIDSTKLPIGQRVRFIKIMGKNAGIGHSSTGDFYGLKLHVLINHAHQICAHKITSGNVHDLVPVKEGFLAGQRGRVYADKGYISKEQRFALMGQNLDFLACPKDNQTYATEEGFKYRLVWDQVHKKAYRKRQKIERVFAILKRSFGLTLSGCKTLRTATTRVYASLLAYTLVQDRVLSFQNV